MSIGDEHRHYKGYIDFRCWMPEGSDHGWGKTHWKTSSLFDGSWQL